MTWNAVYIPVTHKKKYRVVKTSLTATLVSETKETPLIKSSRANNRVACLNSGDVSRAISILIFKTEFNQVTRKLTREVFINDNRRESLTSHKETPDAVSNLSYFDSSFGFPKYFEEYASEVP